LQRVAPSFATISCGMRNSYGHPHEVALQRLRTAGVTILRTDLIGSITWVTDGQRAWLDPSPRAGPVHLVAIPPVQR
jgi:competence protein ComEC